MPIERVTTLDGLRALQADWNALLQRSRANTVFLTWEWLSAWWSAYGTGKNLLLLAAYDEQHVCQGIAPCYVERHHCLGRTLRRLRFLGDGSWDSDYLDFIIANGMEEKLVPAFLGQLAALNTAWDVAQLNEIPATSPTTNLLLEWLRQKNWLVRDEAVPCGIVSLPETWDEYLSHLRPRFRTTIRACLRNLAQWPGGIEYLCDSRDIESWLEDLFHLHGGRWQLRRQQGVFANTEKRAFYRSLAESLLQRGCLHFARWRVANSVLAMQFGFIYGGKYFQLQEGFDRETMHVSPGITLRAATIRDLIERKVRTYDFLGGVARHKTDWGAEVAVSSRYALAPRTMAGLAYVAAPAASDKGKVLLKKLLPERSLQWIQMKRAGTSSDVRSPESLPTDARGSRTKIAAILHWSGATDVIRLISRRFETKTGLRSVVPQWRRVSSSKIAILCYHRVGTGGIPLYSSLPCQTFEAQMRHLRRHYRLVSMDEVCDQIHNSHSCEPAVAVTFDDGYLGTYTEAFPILRRYGIPATVFLTVGAIETGEVSWYDRVFLALQVVTGDKLDLFLDRPRRFNLISSPARMAAAVEIITYLRTCSEMRRAEFCTMLETTVALPREPLAGRMMTWEQVREMHDSGIAFGNHTMTHPVVSRLTPEELDRELAESKAILEQRIGSTVAHFAFPFGKRSDYGVVLNKIPCFGYRSAVTTEWGVNTPMVSRYEMRRVSLGDESYLPMFSLNLSRLFMSSPSDEERVSATENLPPQNSEVCNPENPVSGL